MSDAQFDAFLAALPEVITDEDKRGMILFRGAAKLLTQNSYRAAMRTALGEQLYAEFNA